MPSCEKDRGSVIKSVLLETAELDEYFSFLQSGIIVVVLANEHILYAQPTNTAKTVDISAPMETSLQCRPIGPWKYTHMLLLRTGISGVYKEP